MFFWTDSSNNEEYFILDLFIPPVDYRPTLPIAGQRDLVRLSTCRRVLRVNLRVRAHNALGDSTVCQAQHHFASSPGFEVLNNTSYPVVYLDIDGVN